jgi:hypothetical protein
LASLLAARLDAARAGGAALAVTMGLHPAIGALRRAGFVRVPERLNPRPFNLAVKALVSDVGPDLADAAQWLITLADWDVM